MTLPADLPDRWRDRAEELERYAPPAAEAFRDAAGELAAALAARDDEVLTLQEAADESGYSVRRLRELIADGTIPQAGRKHAPRIRRGYLPRRPGAERTTAGGGGYDPSDDAAELAGRIG